MYNRPVKAVVLTEFGGADKLALTELPDPVPQAGEVLLRVRACALNHLDVWVREGIPAYRKVALPHVLGCDVAGEVAALGPGVTGVKVGERMAVSPGRSCRVCERCLAGRDSHCASYAIIGANGGPGGYAEYLRVPQEYLLPLPPTLSFEEGAAYPLTFLTAWHMTMTLGECGPDQWVLVMGAGSGVGAAAIQTAKLAGARVIAVSTSEEKLERARGLGAEAGIHRPPEDLVRRTLKLTGGAMADLVVEHVGPAVFEDALKALKPGGRLVTCGATSGSAVTLDLRYVFSRQLKVLGSRMGTQAEMRRVARLVGEGKLRPIVDKTFPLAEARAAHERLESRAHFGKVALSV